MPYARPVVLVIFRNNNKILVSRGIDPATKQIFYRPLGGTIEFGERAEDALKREMREELGAEIDNIKYLGTIENIFTYNNHLGHEIDLVYEAKFTDSIFLSQLKIDGREGDQLIKALWLPIKKFEKGELILYPPEILKFLQKK